MSQPQKIGTHQAKSKFSELLSRIIYLGESFIIQRNKKDVALLIPIPGQQPKNKQKKQPKVA